MSSLVGRAPLKRRWVAGGTYRFTRAGKYPCVGVFRELSHQSKTPALVTESDFRGLIGEEFEGPFSHLPVSTRGERLGELASRLSLVGRRAFAQRAELERRSAAKVVKNRHSGSGGSADPGEHSTRAAQLNGGSCVWSFVRNELLAFRRPKSQVGVAHSRRHDNEEEMAAVFEVELADETPTRRQEDPALGA